MDEGSFVPDETMINLVGHEIESASNNNYLLDGIYLKIKIHNYTDYLIVTNFIVIKFYPGFPRTLAQAQKLQQIHPVNLVLSLIVPHSVIIKRVKNRWVHMPSGRVYNIGFNDPKVPVNQ